MTRDEGIHHPSVNGCRRKNQSWNTMLMSWLWAHEQIARGVTVASA